MGWCSGTDVFDTMAEVILSMSELSNITQVILLTRLIEALEGHDWDCQGESVFFEHPRVQEAMKKLHPSWFED